LWLGNDAIMFRNTHLLVSFSTPKTVHFLSGQFLHTAHLDIYLNINTRENEQMTMLCELIKHILLPTCDVSHL